MRAAAYGLHRKSICPIWQKEETHIKYSVIIPVFNDEKYIEKCVCSLLQSAPDGEAEIILVNDGSADSSAEICQRLKDEHDCVKFINKSHGGAATARNAGLETASGEFILFCDADDYVAPDYFSEIEKFKNEDLIIFAYTLIFEHSEEHREIPQEILKSNDDFEKLAALYKSRRLCELYTKRFKRGIIEQNGIHFCEDLPICEDMNFCLQYALCCKSIATKNAPLYFYNRTNKNSVINSRKTGLAELFPKVFGIAANSIEKSDLSDGQKRALLQTTSRFYMASFITCVGEEFKDASASPRKIIKNIGGICKEFKLMSFGGEKPRGILCTGIRICIKLRLRTAIYLLVKAHRKKTAPERK